MTSTLDASPTNGTTGAAGAVSQAKDVALEKTGEARRKIGEQVTERAREQADQHSTTVGNHVTSIAEALQETGSKLRSDGNGAPAKALDSVTEHVEHLGSYLTESNGEQLLHDLEDAARRRPWAVAATLFGVGFAASRVLGASSRTRYESRGGATLPRRTGTVGSSGGYNAYPGGMTSGGVSTGGTLTSGTAGAQPLTDRERTGGTGNVGY